MQYLFRLPNAVSLLAALAVGTIGTSAMAGKDVSIDSVPAPVRATIERETAGGVIDEIELDTAKDGTTVYEVEYHLDGQKYELDIDLDGALLKRSLD